MLVIKKLKRLIDNLPDDACVVAYEGEAIGLRVIHEKCNGWIETGDDDREACDDAEHDLSEIEKAK